MTGMEALEHDDRTTSFRRTDGGKRAADKEADDEHRAHEGAVLYVHGSGATHRAWASQYAPDGPHHPTVAVDLSGHGVSSDIETDPGPEMLSAYVDDVSAIARIIDVDVLVGNSLGSAVVLQAVLDGTVSPSAVVLTGTGAKLSVHEHVRELLADDFEGAIDFLHDDSRLFHDADEAVLERSKAEMRTVGQRVTRRDFLTCHRFDVRERLAEIAVPTLAICGERDRLTPPKYHEYLAEHVQSGRFETVSDAAHLAMVERPDAFNEKLATFLASVDIV